MIDRKGVAHRTLRSGICRLPNWHENAKIDS